MKFADLKEGTDYVISKWINSEGQVFDNYECMGREGKCAFSTIHTELIERHFQKEKEHKHIWGRPGAQGEQPETGAETKAVF